jgi:putative SOS response-associated peptidase YedK
MCGRYRRTTQEEELARLYHIPIPKQTDLPISYNIAPSQKVLTIRFNPKTQQRSLDALEWGLIPNFLLIRKHGKPYSNSLYWQGTPNREQYFSFNVAKLIV